MVDSSREVRENSTIKSNKKGGLRDLLHVKVGQPQSAQTHTAVTRVPFLPLPSPTGSSCQSPQSSTSLAFDAQTATALITKIGTNEASKQQQQRQDDISAGGCHN